MDEKKPIDIQVQADDQTLVGKYSTMAQVTHTAEEFFLDFIAILPNPPIARLLSRIIVSPGHAKRLAKALADNISKYEARFGIIDEAKAPLPTVGFKQ